MVQRIQRFTTQRIPAATISGLEPRTPEPAPRPKFGANPGGFGGKPGHKRFGNGPKPGYGKPFARGGAAKPGR